MSLKDARASGWALALLLSSGHLLAAAPYGSRSGASGNPPLLRGDRGRPRVQVTTEGSGAVADAIAVELEAAGYTLALGVPASLQIVVGGDVVAIEYRPPDEGEPRRTSVRPGPGELPRVVAFQTMERLRALLRGARRRPRPPPPGPRQKSERNAPAARVPTAEPPAPVAIDLGGFVGPGITGKSAWGGAHLAAVYYVLPSLGIGGQAWVPATAQEIRRTEGSADVWPTLLMASVSWRPLTGRWSVTVDGGGGVSWMPVEASAAASFSGRATASTAAAFHLSPSLSWAITPTIALVARGLVGASVPQQRVRFAGRNVASWGAPLGAVCLGIRFTPR